MGKVETYEHKGMRLSGLPTKTIKDILLLQDLFRKESDQWLRKIIAKKILSQTLILIDDGERNELLEAIKVRIK